MSAASRAKAAEKAAQNVLALFESRRKRLEDWLAKNIDPETAAANRAGTERVFEESERLEPIPHWVLPLGESLVNPDYFSPPTAEIDGKPSPVLTVRAFHHSLDPVLGVTLNRAALGAPWVRVA